MKPLIIANWKMNPPSLVKAKQLFNSIKKDMGEIKKVEVVICPPFIYLSNLHPPTHNLQLGSQDVFWEEKGAFTGEVSAIMLKNLGCQYVILGHSERRRYFGETDEMINKKIRAALSAKLIPILCIGETKEERKSGKTFEVLKRQLEKDLFGISDFNLSPLDFVIAYEPIWAIGTGNPCSPEDAKVVADFIRKQLPKSFPVLYGGSVKSHNAKSFVEEGKMDGLLVGGASLDSKEFIKIVRVTIP